MRATWVILGKELREAVRDRRSALAVTAYALVGPLVLWFVLGYLERNARAERDVRVHFINAESAPGLRAALAEQGIADSTGAPVVVEVQRGFREALAADGEPVVTVRADLARFATPAAKVRRAVDRYAAGVAEQRLLARGVTPGEARAITVDVQDLAEAPPGAQFVIGALVFIVLSAPFFGGIAIAADATAGERERHALGLLLQQPIGAWQVVVGKWGAVACAGIVSLIGTAAGVGLVLSRVAHAGGESAAGLTLGIRDGALLVATLLPLVATVAALQLLVAVASRTYKEAQSYLNVLSLLPFVALLIGQAARGPGGNADALPLPILWEARHIESLIAGRAFAVLPGAAAAFVHVLVTAAMLMLAAWIMHRVVQRDG